MSSLVIPFPAELRPRLPTIVGNVDYLTLRQRLEQVDRLLHEGAVEEDFVHKALQGWLARASNRPSVREQPLPLTRMDPPVLTRSDPLR